MQSPYQTWQQFQRPRAPMPQLPFAQPQTPAYAAPAPAAPPAMNMGPQKTNWQQRQENMTMAPPAMAPQMQNPGASFFGRQRGLQDNVSRPWYAVQRPQPMAPQPMAPQPMAPAPMAPPAAPTPSSPLDMAPQRAPMPMGAYQSIPYSPSMTIDPPQGYAPQTQQYSMSHMLQPLGVTRNFARGGLACKCGGS